MTRGTAAAHGVAFIRGMPQAGVAATAKHFPGLGRVLGNTDFTAGVVDTTTVPDDPSQILPGASTSACPSSWSPWPPIRTLTLVISRFSHGGCV
jgi:hypothetical protein